MARSPDLAAAAAVPEQQQQQPRPQDTPESAKALSVETQTVSDTPPVAPPSPPSPHAVEVPAKTAKTAVDVDAATAAHRACTGPAPADTAPWQLATATAAATATATAEAAPETTAPPPAPSKETPPEAEEQPWTKPYYLEGGLRRVEPYYFTYNTWVKERWRGRTLIDVFESEFRDRPLAYYRRAMETGTVSVNGKTVGPDHVLRNGERIAHTIHRHEPPVTAEPIAVIHEDADMLVINKPAGVPVHPAGRYMYNSVVELLKAARGPSFVPYPCNRLDRLTSGIMFVAKSPATAKRLSLQIQARAVRKEYLARVVGRFPDGGGGNNNNNDKNGSGEVICDQPILQISPMLGLNRVRASGRSALTVFKRLAYYGPDETGGGGDADDAAAKESEGKDTGDAAEASKKLGYSIVRCLPVTGRTHQIRVHLQYLGHPIENDPIYANQRVWGLGLGRGDADASQNSDEDIVGRLKRMGKEDVAEAVAYYDEMVDAYHKRKAEKMSGELCAVCDTPLYTDPGVHELSLWLHSLRYEAHDGSWSYVSPLPGWALPPAGAAGPTSVGALADLAVAADEVAPVEPDVEAEAGAGAEAAALPAALAAKTAKAAKKAAKTRTATAAAREKADKPAETTEPTKPA